MSSLTTDRAPLRSPPSEQLAAGRLSGAVVPVTELGADERARMLELLQAYFVGTTREVFERDLAEKHWALLLTDRESGALQGFSTLQLLWADVDGQQVPAFFSGDTIIERAYWGDPTLAMLWGQHVFRAAGGLGVPHVYWMLICSGYKTYRFLPLYFRRFYPTHAEATPPLARRTLDAIAAQKFGPRYDSASGIIHLEHATPLRDDVAAISERRLRDPHVAFFSAANPGHAAGDELACLTEIHPANLTPAGRRVVGAAAHWER